MNFSHNRSTASGDLTEVVYVPSSLQKVKYFFQAPVTKFCYTVVSFIIRKFLRNMISMIWLSTKIPRASFFWDDMLFRDVRITASSVSTRLNIKQEFPCFMDVSMINVCIVNVFFCGIFQFPLFVSCNM